MPIIDFHCDTLLKLVKEQRELSLKNNKYSVDINKLQQAGSIAQFFAAFVDLKKTQAPMQKALLLIDRFHQEIDDNKESMALALSYDDLVHNQAVGKISAFLTLEEGDVIEGNLWALRNFYRLGVRLVTITWNYPNSLGFPNKDPKYQFNGLTLFGREVIREMNHLGMIIDVSHLSDAGFYDVAELSVNPFMASHSDARAVFDHRRNLTDDMLKTLAAKGGLIGGADVFFGVLHACLFSVSILCCIKAEWHR